MNLNGRIAVVTGATKGVGRGIARELGRQGARVFVTGRSVEEQETLGEGVTGIRCDHRQDDQVTAVFSRIAQDAGRVDILVNNVWGGYDEMVDNGMFNVSKTI